MLSICWVVVAIWACRKPRQAPNIREAVINTELPTQAMFGLTI